MIVFKEEKDWGLRDSSVDALPEDIGFIPNTHMVAQNHRTPVPGDPIPTSGLYRH